VVNLRPSYFLFLLLFFPVSGEAREFIPGPILADVKKVRDGDSIIVHAHIWPGHSVQVSVRLRGIDAPEIRGKCEVEKQAALVAKLEVEQLVGSQQVQLIAVSGGKYFGRVLAQVLTKDGIDVAKHLLRQKMVRRYKGGKRLQWCAENAAELSGS